MITNDQYEPCVLKEIVSCNARRRALTRLGHICSKTIFITFNINLIPIFPQTQGLQDHPWAHLSFSWVQFRACHKPLLLAIKQIHPLPKVEWLSWNFVPKASLHYDHMPCLLACHCHDLQAPFTQYLASTQQEMPEQVIYVSFKLCHTWAQYFQTVTVTWYEACTACETKCLSFNPTSAEPFSVGGWSLTDLMNCQLTKIEIYCKSSIAVIVSHFTITTCHGLVHSRYKTRCIAK